MPRFAPNKGKGKGPLIASAILASPSSTAAEIAATFSCSRIYAQKIRERLIREGKLTSRLSPRKVASRPDAELAPQLAPLASSTESLDQPMTLAQRRLHLSRLAQNAEHEAIQVAASNALNRLEATIKSTDDLGPSAPLTSAEADERITQLIVAREEVFGTHFHRRPRATVATSDP